MPSVRVSTMLRTTTASVQNRLWCKKRLRLSFSETSPRPHIVTTGLTAVCKRGGRSGSGRPILQGDPGEVPIPASELLTTWPVHDSYSLAKGPLRDELGLAVTTRNAPD